MKTFICSFCVRKPFMVYRAILTLWSLFQQHLICIIHAKIHRIELTFNEYVTYERWSLLMLFIFCLFFSSSFRLVWLCFAMFLMQFVVLTSSISSTSVTERRTSFSTAHSFDVKANERASYNRKQTTPKLMPKYKHIAMHVLMESSIHMHASDATGESVYTALAHTHTAQNITIYIHPFMMMICSFYVCNDEIVTKKYVKTCWNLIWNELYIVKWTASRK